MQIKNDISQSLVEEFLDDNSIEVYDNTTYCNRITNINNYYNALMEMDIK